MSVKYNIASLICIYFLGFFILRSAGSLYLQKKSLKVCFILMLRTLAFFGFLIVAGAFLIIFLGLTRLNLIIGNSFKLATTQLELLYFSLQILLQLKAIVHVQRLPNCYTRNATHKH